MANKKPKKKNSKATVIDKPWEKSRWLPGVLNKEQMKALIDCGLLLIKDKTNIQMDYSALDLHITDEGYLLVNGTTKPSASLDFNNILNDKYYCSKLKPESNGTFPLEAGKSYIFKVAESFRPTLVSTSPIHAQATAKSSIGRLDVVARLIVEGMGEYETMFPGLVKTGDMYLEITPITFNIIVKEGDSLSQIRFFNGHFRDALIDGDFYKNVLHDGGDNRTLSVNISKDSAIHATAFVAKKINPKEFIEISKPKHSYDPNKFWTTKNASEDAESIQSLKIEQNNFYILRSKERIGLPGGVAVYCKAMDETIGELRIHYAGFVHPFFGIDRIDGKPGTPLIFEVRGHNINVNLTEGEILARLIFYRMSKDAIKDRPKPQKKSTTKNKKPNSEEYNNQELLLSKYFKPWK